MSDGPYHEAIQFIIMPRYRGCAIHIYIDLNSDTFDPFIKFYCDLTVVNREKLIDE